jgi:uncharacterized protein YggT (Ycf19 family)
MTGVAVLSIELAMLMVLVDLLVGWVQPDTSRPPHRLLHALTEPALRPLRRVSRAWGWDWSPLVLILLLGALRVVLERA